MCYSWVVNLIPGVHFQKALFVPNISVYYKVLSTALPPTDPQVDLSWQLTLQNVWENLIGIEKGTTFTFDTFSFLDLLWVLHFCVQHLNNVLCGAIRGPFNVFKIFFEGLL